MARVENGVLHLDRLTVLKGDEAYWDYHAPEGGDIYERYRHSVPVGSLGYNTTTKKLISGFGYNNNHIGGGAHRNFDIGEGDISVVDNYNSNSATDCISAAKGKDLNDRLTSLEETELFDIESITSIVCG